MVAYIENEVDKNRALDFLQWLRTNKMSPSAGNNGYNWYVNFKYVDYNKCKNGNYYRETWKVRADSDCYFLKMDYLSFHQEKSQQSLSVIEYLCQSGIDFGGKIIKTRENKLYSNFDTAVIGLFEWVDGKNVETNQTKSAEYQMLCKIYLLTKPGLRIPTALFSDDESKRFYHQWEMLESAQKQMRTVRCFLSLSASKMKYPTVLQGSLSLRRSAGKMRAPFI